MTSALIYFSRIKREKNKMNEKIKQTAAQLLYGKFFPLLLLLVMACTFAIQVPQLGFYLDDWVSVAAYDQGGEAGLIAFGIDDSRPFAAWVTAKFFAILGTGVLQWQLITLFWRYAAGLTTFALLSSVWPKRRTAAGFSALLFGVFPYFSHQAICIAYFMILMQYFVILFSFLLTVKALQTQKPALKILLFVLSYLTSLFHLACLEYYLSLEAARLILIFVVLRHSGNSGFKAAAGRAILTYIPYILILGFILVYRFVYIPSLSPDVRQVNMFTKYSGLNVIWHFAGLFLQYLTEALLGVWYRSINPSNLDLTIRNTQLGLFLGLAAAVLIFLLLQKARQDNASDQRDLSEMLFLGAAAMMLGFLPGMAIDISPASASTYQDRYLIPSFWGITVFTVAWITLAFKNPAVRSVLFSVLICIAVFFQIQTSYNYRYSWKYQQQYQWQLKWRVPDLAENTAIVGDGVIAPFMGGWADGSMIFEMYGKHKGVNPTPYWFFNIGEDNYLSAIGTGQPLAISSKMYDFETASENILLVTKPEYGKCAWVLDEEDIDNPFLEGLIYQYIPYQNKSRIVLESDYQLPASVFGTDYLHDWCYYFEKADLAFDRQDYEETLRLYDEAESKGIGAGNPVEMRPFIKAAAFAGQWEKALEWTELAYFVNPVTHDYFDNLWTLLDRDLPGSAEKSAAIAAVREILGASR